MINVYGKILQTMLIVLKQIFFLEILIGEIRKISNKETRKIILSEQLTGHLYLL